MTAPTKKKRTRKKRPKKTAAKDTDRIAEIEAQIDRIEQDYDAWGQQDTWLDAHRATENMRAALPALNDCIQRLPPRKAPAGRAYALSRKILAGLRTIKARQKALDPMRDDAITLAGQLDAVAEGAWGPSSAIKKLRKVASNLRDFAIPTAIDLSPYAQLGIHWTEISCDLKAVLEEALVALETRSPEWDGGTNLRQQSDALLRNLTALENGETLQSDTGPQPPVGAAGSKERVSPEAVSNTNLKRARKAGRKPLSSKEAQRRASLVADWQRAHDSGVSKADFCQDKSIEGPYLQQCLDWSRKRQRRGASAE